MQDGEGELIITDADIDMDGLASPLPATAAAARFDTEWVLFTSGTSGVPKLVLHSLASLTAPLRNGPRFSAKSLARSVPPFCARCQPGVA